MTDFRDGAHRTRVLASNGRGVRCSVVEHGLAADFERLQAQMTSVVRCRASRLTPASYVAACVRVHLILEESLHLPALAGERPQPGAMEKNRGDARHAQLLLQQATWVADYK